MDAGDDVFPPDASDIKDEDKGDGPDENGFPEEPEIDLEKSKSSKLILKLCSGLTIPTINI